MNQQPQPLVHCYNPVQVLWTDIECKYLLNYRMVKNDEFWNLSKRGKEDFGENW